MRLLNDEIFGFVRPSIDAHTLGISYVAKLLREAGYHVVIGDGNVTDAVNSIGVSINRKLLIEWLKTHRITRLGLSYRLDPIQGVKLFDRLYSALREEGLIFRGSDSLRGLYFAGLPDTCDRVRQKYQDEVTVFGGDEGPVETLMKLGVPANRISTNLKQVASYDDARKAFAVELLSKGEYQFLRPQDRSGYPGFGTRSDHLCRRIRHSRLKSQSALMRVHVGPYAENRREAVNEFIFWLKQLANAGFLDVVSIGTSQLTQERFGEDWQDAPNGGGVPINSAAEYSKVSDAARPMLVRTYAGTKRIPHMARIHESTLNMAWHALSFWWFSRIDGRGPNSVYRNLCEHLDTLAYIAQTGKPFEPNIPHHFAFRGGDDVTYVLSALIAAKTAKLNGVRFLVLQNMLNTPKHTLGVQDLAKSRAMLQLVRELEDENFRVILQPRAGLDYFSPDLQRAKVQLAAVSMLMDDIEPQNDASPPLIHVVSYSEASHLATPPIIDESIKITRHAIAQYRLLRQRGLIDDMAQDVDVKQRADSLKNDVRQMMASIEKTIPNPYSAAGLYRLFAAGFLAAPYLWGEQDEFRHVINWKTDFVNGGVAIVDENNLPIPIDERISICLERARNVKMSHGIIAG